MFVVNLIGIALFAFFFSIVTMVFSEEFGKIAAVAFFTVVSVVVARGVKHTLSRF